MGILLLICVLGLFMNAVAAADDMNETSMVGAENGKMTVESKDVSDDIHSSDDERIENMDNGDDKLGSENAEVLSAWDSSLYALWYDTYFTPVGEVYSLDHDFKYQPAYDDVNALYMGVPIHKSITIMGNGHIIDGLNLHNLLFVYGNNVIINNVTFINGYETSGGPIHIYGDNVQFINCKFINNTGADGGAIEWAMDSNGCLEGCTFQSNYATTNGGALNLNDNVEISGCEFINNSARFYGGAIYVQKNVEEQTIMDSTFIQNRAAKQGGAVYLQGRKACISSSQFDNNTAEEGGAVYVENDDCEIISTGFTKNTARTGGAIHWKGNDGKLSGSAWSHIIENNYASFGGAIYWEGDNASIENCWLDHNEAKEEGGAILLAGKNAKVQTSNINYNHAHYGGAIFVSEDSEQATVNKSSFYLNNADYYGGAIYWQGLNGKIDESVFNSNIIDSKTNTAFGGAVFWKGENALINNSKFINNRAYSNGPAYGGALDIDNDYATVSNSVFENNRVGTDGGAINWEGNYGTVYNSSFTGNDAPREGGAIKAIGKNILINGSNFTKNNAYYLIGGAISLEASGRIDDSRFVENYAYKGGAIHWIDKGLSIVNNSYFYKNHAMYGGGAISCDFNYFGDVKYIQNSKFEENYCVNYGGAIASLDTEIDNCIFIKNNAHLGGAVHSYDSKIVASQFSDNTADYGNDIYHSNELSLIDTVVPEENIEFVPSDLVEVEYSPGNSTRLMNNSYVGLCFERCSLKPYFGTYDGTLHALINIHTGESIVEYLKILIYDVYNSMDEVYPQEGDNFMLYPEGEETNYEHNMDPDHLKPISRMDYYSRVVHIFSDGDFRKSNHPEVKRILELYENGIRIDNGEEKVIDGKVIKYTFTTMISSASQSLFLFNIEEVNPKNKTSSGNDNSETNPNMTVQKISLNKTVKLGEQVGFVILVTNTGDCDLTGVYVIDDDYTNGLVFDHFVSNGDWNFDGKNKFTYAYALERGESTKFTVYFNTTSAGFKVNNVTAGNNLTNETVNSTNVTNVTEDKPPIVDRPADEPPVVEPSKPDIEVPKTSAHPKHDVASKLTSKNATGNPVMLLLLALFIPLIRRGRKHE